MSIYFLINFSVFSFEINCQMFMCCQNCIECMGCSSVSMVCPCPIHSYRKTLSVKFTCFHSQQSTRTCVTNSDIDHFMVFLSDSLLFSLRQCSISNVNIINYVEYMLRKHFFLDPSWIHFCSMIHNRSQAIQCECACVSVCVSE